MVDSSYLMLRHFEYIKKNKKPNKRKSKTLNKDIYDTYPSKNDKRVVFENPLIKKSSPVSSVESDAETVVVSPSDEIKHLLRSGRFQH
jgi:hypothetical protein